MRTTKPQTFHKQPARSEDPDPLTDALSRSDTPQLTDPLLATTLGGALQRLQVGVVPSVPGNYRNYTDLGGDGNGWSFATWGGGNFNASDRNHVYDNNVQNAPDNPPAPDLADDPPVSDDSGDTLLTPGDASDIYPEVDHIVPVADMGANDWKNARILSKRENNNGAPARPGVGARTLRTYQDLDIRSGTGDHDVSAGDSLSNAQVRLLNRFAGNGNTASVSGANVSEIIGTASGTANGVSVNDADSDSDSDSGMS